MRKASYWGDCARSILCGVMLGLKVVADGKVRVTAEHGDGGSPNRAMERTGVERLSSVSKIRVRGRGDDALLGQRRKRARRRWAGARRQLRWAVGRHVDGMLV